MYVIVRRNFWNFFPYQSNSLISSSFNFSLPRHQLLQVQLLLKLQVQLLLELLLELQVQLLLELQLQVQLQAAQSQVAM